MGLRIDAYPLGQTERTPQGGLRIPATLTRVGVFAYTQPDGTIRREYRSPAEVFAPESLAMLRGAPVTDLHPGDGRVDSADWRRKAVGHAGEDVRQDGPHVAATLYVQDADVVRKVEARERDQVSVGYDVTYVPGPGVSPEGEAFDGLQTKIRPNHVALVPKGRAGASVGLRLDAADNQIQERDPVKIKIGGREYEAGTPECQAAIDAQATRLDAAEKAEKASRLVALRAQVAPLKVDLRADADESSIMLDVLKKIAPGVSVEGASPEFILGAFSAALSIKLGADDVEAADEAEEPEPVPGAPPGPSAASVRTDAIDARRKRAAKAAKPSNRQDADDDEGPAEKARKAMIKAGQNRGGVVAA